MYQMNVSNDIHICGVCRQQFDDLNVFHHHKKQCVLLQSEKTLFAVNEDLTLEEDNELYLNETLFDLSVIENGTLPIFLQCSNEEIVTDNNENKLEVVNLNQNGILNNPKKTNVILEKITNTQDNAHALEVSNALKSDVPAALIRKKRHVCNICNHEELYTRDLKRHMRTHTGERPFMCRYCDKRFARKDKLTVHERRHTDDRRYKCEECEYSTTDGSALWSHKRTHSGERPHRCQICSYQARSTSHLALHLRTHTGDRPFFCKIKSCGRAFKTSMDLKRHSHSHRLNLNDHCTNNNGVKCIKKGPKIKNRSRIHCTKSHKCLYCEAAFVRADSLRSHIKLHS